MTTPDVPLRMELTFELPGTPEQVWDAIATANGISAWIMPTDLEEREGGAVAFHMGEATGLVPGTVTGWEPPGAHRLRGAGLGRDAPATTDARGHAAGHRVPRRGPVGRHLRASGS